MQKILVVLLLSLLSTTVFSADLLVEAESFDDKGGWMMYQQAYDSMGSAYLMAHGLGKPVADATTWISLEEEGVYHVYARTFNWTSPWYSSKGPGAFQLKINHKTLATQLGVAGAEWEWQYAGKLFIKAGKSSLSLVDKTGFNGRCDAVYLSTQATRPPNDLASLAAFRKEKLALSPASASVKRYDLVVVGGGIAGMCAAVSAARLGCKVALVNDRPVLGGNNSTEVRVHLGGHIEQAPYVGLGRLIREFGHTKKGNAMPEEYYEDHKKEVFIENEPNVELFASTRAIEVVMDGKSTIKAVVIKHLETGVEQTLEALCFSDCTGDGTIGYLAGADYRMGRESRAEFGESIAPERADAMTMGASVQWYSVEEKSKQHFPLFQYGLQITEENSEKVSMGEWTWEVGMNMDQVTEIEKVRDYGLLVVFSNWSFLKNQHMLKKNYEKRRLGWVAGIAGKRESRRLLGDYILKQDDIHKQVFHEDASFTTTWSIDLHFPDSLNSAHFPGAEFKAATKHLRIYPYAVPYRCLYSRNINNLFMAGRNISQTHVALGTTRVMRTTGMMGEVVGMAASLCIKYQITPREVYQKHLPELQDLMMQGVGKKDVPDTQHFNKGTYLKGTPKFESIREAVKKK